MSLLRHQARANNQRRLPPGPSGARNRTATGRLACLSVATVCACDRYFSPLMPTTVHPSRMPKDIAWPVRSVPSFRTEKKRRLHNRKVIPEDAPGVRGVRLCAVDPQRGVRKDGARPTFQIYLHPHFWALLDSKLPLPAPKPLFINPAPLATKIPAVPRDAHPSHPLHTHM